MVLDLISTSYIGWPTSRFVSLMIDNASEVQGECRAELARAMLSRSLHSYSQLPDCEYKGTQKINTNQVISMLVPDFLLYNFVSG